jgi:hypothetical protein
MKWTDEQIQARYAQMDLDENEILQHRIHEQICAKKSSFKRKTVWGLCAAGIAAAVLIIIGQFIPQQPAYLPSPAEFTQMQFAFYRELALPGQDLGISYDDFPQDSSPARS